MQTESVQAYDINPGDVILTSPMDMTYSEVAERYYYGLTDIVVLYTTDGRNYRGNATDLVSRKVAS